VLEPSHPGKRGDAGATAQALLNGSGLRRIFLESQVAPIARVVVHIFTDNAPEVVRVEHDHPV
jgi:hypothetical protein